ncbi:uncharacterized protein [Spinacia oleracea]|uniref:Uncharacterized protein LOC110788676 n=1 Tax=Spinacia oleracea TaxID=3562 RepID=A0A9R0JWD6_SPIOL|nr:uncharacterized protein LOC110788676 [Spinacia oleracea]XP_056690906.1 uncharacterized protein LOC130466229 [Spinacia oleracea]
MGDNILLKFMFGTGDVDVVVDDIDKVMLVDLIIDFCDNAVKQKNEIPKFPSFTYMHKNERLPLNTDNELMKMFSNLNGKDVINIWVSDEDKPSQIFKVVTSLRTTRNAKELKDVMRGVVEKFGITVNDGGNIGVERNDDVVAFSPPELTSRRSLRLEEEILVIPNLNFGQNKEPYNPDEVDWEAMDALNRSNDDTWLDFQLSPVKSRGGCKARGGGRSRGRGAGRGGRRGSARGRGRGPTRGFEYWLGLENETNIATDPIVEHEPVVETHESNEQEIGIRVVRRSPRKHKQPVIQPVITPELVTEPQLETVIEPNLILSRGSSLSSKASVHRKKIPKTTARRKGLLVSGNSVSGGGNEQLNRSVTISVDVDDNALSIRNKDFDGDENDSEFNVSGSDIGGSDSDELSADDEDNVGLDGDTGMVVVDNYDPYVDDVWVDDGVDDDGDGNYFAKLYRNGEMFEEKENVKIELKPWHLFCDKNHLRDVVRDYCIQRGFSVVVDRANNSIYTVYCSAEGCEWRLHASRLADGFTWAIKSIKNPEHTCLGLEIRNPMVTAKWASRVLLEDIRANNDISAKSLNLLLWNKFKVKMATSTLYRVRARALIEIHGGFDESYAHLPGYCEMIRKTNPQSVASCVWNPANHVDRPLAFVTIFISFKACVDGLRQGVRGFVGVDGAHLKGNYGGVLLSAVALDGNNELFPFAWGIVSNEDADTWCFFVHHLRDLLRSTGRGDEWCVISDRHQGIEVAFNKLWPEVDRRYCTKHLSGNWKKAFPGPLMLSLFWKATGAYSTFTFRKAMEQIDKVGKGGRLWLAKLGNQARWSKHKFNVATKCDVNTSNFVESFNATLGIDRCRPVLTLLEGIRRNTMVRLATRRQMCEEWTRNDVCPNIVKRVQKLCHDSRTCHSFLCSEGEFEIFEGKSYLPVSLNNQTCICGQWQISGIPCRHGMRAILDAQLDPHAFVDEWHSVRRYKLAYSSGIKSIPDFEQWPDMNMPKILPPELKRGIGRPCRNRKRDDTEEKKGKRAKTVMCSKCREFGHNAKTCKGGATAKQKWGKGKNKKTPVQGISSPSHGFTNEATTSQQGRDTRQNTQQFLSQSVRLTSQTTMQYASHPVPARLTRSGSVFMFASQPRHF